MTSQISRQAVEAMREVVGAGPAETELIRCLHLAKSDVPQAVNIYFDLAAAGRSSRESLVARLTSSGAHHADQHCCGEHCCCPTWEAPVDDHGFPAAHTARALAESAAGAAAQLREGPVESGQVIRRESIGESRGTSAHGRPEPPQYTAEERAMIQEQLRRDIQALPPSFNDRVEARLKRKRQEAEARAAAGDTAMARDSTRELAIQPAKGEAEVSAEGGWWFLGEGTVECMSQAKGKKLTPGQEVELSFPKAVQQQLQGFAGTSKESTGSRNIPWFVRNSKLNQRDLIIRFGTRAGGEVGSLPIEWGRMLVPLVVEGKVRLTGQCLRCPEYLNICDKILLIMRVYVQHEMLFQKRAKQSDKAAEALSETCEEQPFTMLLKFLGMEPSQRAAFTPLDFKKKKTEFDMTAAPQDFQVTSLPQPATKRVGRPRAGGRGASEVGGGVEPTEGDGAPEVALSDSEVNKFVGISENVQLPEMEAPEDLMCELRGYQKQALKWMYDLEEGEGVENSAKNARTLHPCWESYHIPHNGGTTFYHNVFSGETTLEFPSAMQRSRGGILADAMGLGKTVMTISLIVANNGRGGIMNESLKARVRARAEALAKAQAHAEAQVKLQAQTKAQAKADAQAKKQEGHGEVATQQEGKGEEQPGRRRLRPARAKMKVVKEGEGAQAQEVERGGEEEGEEEEGEETDEDDRDFDEEAETEGEDEADEEGEKEEDEVKEKIVEKTEQEIINEIMDRADKQRHDQLRAQVLRESGGKTDNANSGGTLIVCPMTLLDQWKSECETHTRRGAISAFKYYGGDRGNGVDLWRQIMRHDVVLTTYGTLQSEHKRAGQNGLLFYTHWFRVVLDEAHCIKNRQSASAAAAFALTSDTRWCLTGTPIQNQLEDIYSLLRFLRVQPWDNWGWWQRLVQTPYQHGDMRSLKLLQGLLRPLMLRRTKGTVDQLGKPILVLPPIHTEVVSCTLSDAERDFYNSLHERSKVKFDTFVAEGRVLHNYASILEMLLRLRQTCDHPFLVLSRGDTLEYADLNKLGRKYLTTCPGAKAPDRSHAEGEALVKACAPILSTAGGPSEAFVMELVERVKKGEGLDCPICMECAEDPVLSPCAHSFCRECILQAWQGKAEGSCPTCRKEFSKRDLITVPRANRFTLDVHKNWTPSVKIRMLIDRLQATRHSGEKSLVFSQWTAFLDLLEIAFRRAGVAFVRLDGTLNLQQREKALAKFRAQDSGVQVMLISLKAGGVGINLTAGNHAYIMDPWWNPAVEEQAIMRVHRIGQTRPVKVTRFIVKDSVEERMQAVQDRKQQLVNGALTNEEVRNTRLEELKMLFR